MILKAVVVLTLLSSALTLPLATQYDEITGIEGLPQIQGEISQSQQVQKTGVQGSFQINKQVQINKVEKSTVHSGASEQHTEVKKQIEGTSNVVVSPQNAAVPKVENVPVNVEPAQTSYTENPVLLPIQPLSVVPTNQAGHVLQPVVVPVETVSAERVVVTGTDSSQKRNFQQNVNNVPESQTSYQQVVQPVIYTQVPTQNVEPNQQPNYVTLAEKPDQSYFPVQVQPNLNPLVREQTVPVVQAAQQSVVPILNYNQTSLEPSAQVYGVQQNEQSVITEDAKNQVSTGYSPLHFVEPSVQHQQQYHVQQSVKKQVPHQQGNIQSQANFVQSTESENIVKQVSNQQYSDAQTQNVEQNYQQQQDYNTQQVVKKQVPYPQVNSYPSVQNQPAGQSLYNVEHNTVEKTEKTGQYPEGYYSVQTQSVEPQQQQIQNAQQVIEKQVPYQQPVAVQTYPVEPVNQQQVFSGQPLTAGQVENQVQYQKGSQFQNVGYFLQKAPVNPEFEPNQQVFTVQPQEVAHYAGEFTHSFGDETSQVQQNAPVHTLASVPQTQDYSVQPPVGSA